MAITIDGTTGITTPGLVNTGTESVVGLTTTGNTILGDASTDTLNVGNGGLVKDASGNVGIGTSSPACKLNVVSSDNTEATVIQSLMSNNASAQLRLGFNRIVGYNTVAGNSSLDLGVTNSPQAVHIDPSGNVGIGKSSPTAKLDVTTSINLGQNYLNVGYDVGGGAGWIAGYNTTYNAGVKNVNTGALSSVYYNSSGIQFYTNGSAAPGTVAAERMRIDSSGNLLVGTTSSAINGATAQLKVTGNTGSIGFDSTGTNLLYGRNGVNYIVANGGTSAVIQVISNTGGVQLSNGATSWTAISDETKKDIIEPITDASNKVLTLRAVIGKYKTDKEGTRRSFLIAQDVQKVLPEAISEIGDDGDKALGLSYTDTIPLLVAAIQELKAIIDTQNDTINNLTTRLETLEGAV